MKQVSNKLLLAAAMAALLAGCDSGGINIEPETIDNSTGGSSGGSSGGGSGNNPCAFYEKAGEKVQGTFDSGSGNCTYAPSFVDAGNNLVVDLFIPELENDGAHIFEGSLFVGENYTNSVDLAAAGISEGGDGVKLTIEAGATIAFPSQIQFLAVNRGSQIFAVGTKEEPITFTSVSDIEGTLESPEAVSQWGGMVINGFGYTNKCGYAETGNVEDGSLKVAGDCYVLAEGAEGKYETGYGGDNNKDNSGQLEYVVVKHTGAEVANADELNGISFGAVGSGTIVRNLQTYSTYDDGIEMFGGAVSFENYLAVYVNDDAIDIDEGWRGSITNALVIQSETNGNRCIEADGIGSYKDTNDYTAMIAAGLNSRPVIDGLTCIISPKEGARGPGAGWYLHEGIYPTIVNSMVVSSFAENDSVKADDNSCLRVEDAETVAALEAGVEAKLTSNIFACQEKVAGDAVGGGTETWAESTGNLFADITGAVDATSTSSTDLQILEGVPSFYTINTDSMVVNDAAITISPTASPLDESDVPAARAYFGALSQGDLDWTQGWTYGLHEGSRAQPLWFEQQ